MTTNIQESNWRKELPPTYESTYEKEKESSSEAVRSEIEATRGRLSSQFDQLQERLQPDNIKQQAQSAVQSALTDSVGAVKEYVNDYAQQINWNEMRDGLLDSVRRNPVPAALIGV